VIAHFIGTPILEAASGLLLSFRRVDGFVCQTVDMVIEVEYSGPSGWNHSGQAFEVGNLVVVLVFVYIGTWDSIKLLRNMKA